MPFTVFLQFIIVLAIIFFAGTEVEEHKDGKSIRLGFLNLFYHDK